MNIDELYDHLISDSTQTKLNDMLRDARTRGLSKEQEELILQENIRIGDLG